MLHLLFVGTRIAFGQGQITLNGIAGLNRTHTNIHKSYTYFVFHCNYL